MARIRRKGIFGERSFTFIQPSPSFSSYILHESGEDSRKISLTNTILESPLHPQAQSFVTVSSLFFLLLSDILSSRECPTKGCLAGLPHQCTEHAETHLKLAVGIFMLKLRRSWIPLTHLNQLICGKKWNSIGYNCKAPLFFLHLPSLTCRLKACSEH